jgi:CubicO group peptidase (beta-lactamase class C family)
VFERYYRGVRAADHLAVFSITKTVISALVGIALADRKLRSVDDRLVDLLPQAFGPATDPQARLITLRHLLTMTGGFVAFARYRSEDPVPALINRPVFHEPGTTFRYDSGSSDLLSAVVTRATGMTAAAYARLRLFGPVGIRGARWASQGAGLSEGGSGLMLRPRDLPAFGQLYLDSGRWRGRQVVPSAWVAASTRTRIPLGHGRGYGYDWWTEDAPVRSFAALGYPGQAIIVFPRLDEVVVVTSAGEDFRPRFVLAQMVVRATRH